MTAETRTAVILRGRIEAAMQPLLDEVARQRQAVDAVQKLCDAQRAYCNGARLDVPSWVVSVEAALGGGGT